MGAVISNLFIQLQSVGDCFGRCAPGKHDGYGGGVLDGLASTLTLIYNFVRVRTTVPLKEMSVVHLRGVKG